MFPWTMLLCNPLPAKRIFWLLPAFFLLALLWRPVDVFIMRAAHSPGAAPLPPVFQDIAPLGQEVWTHFLHSVERTPVLDCYRIVNGRIWTWREYVQSHNAGLPFQKPPCGRFIMDAPWMIVEGERQAWERLALRVGNAELGRNAFAYGRGMPDVWRPLYESHPGERLLLAVERRPLLHSLK